MNDFFLFIFLSLSFSFSFLFRYFIRVNFFDETGYVWTRAPSMSPLHFHFLCLKTSSLLIFLLFSKKLIYLCLVKSPMKPDTLDGTLPWLSSQIVTVENKMPYHHHSNLYLFLSFFFLCLFSLGSFPSFILFYIFSIIYIFLQLLKCRKKTKRFFSLKRFFLE